MNIDRFLKNFLKFDPIEPRGAFYFALVIQFIAILLAMWVIENSGMRAEHVEQIELARRIAEGSVIFFFIFTFIWLYSKIVTLVNVLLKRIGNK